MTPGNSYDQRVEINDFVHPVVSQAKPRSRPGSDVGPRQNLPENAA